MTKEAFEKVRAGLTDALLITRIAGEIIDMLPAGAASPELHSRIIAALAPHVSAQDEAEAERNRIVALLANPSDKLISDVLAAAKRNGVVNLRAACVAFADMIAKEGGGE